MVVENRWKESVEALRNFLEETGANPALVEDKEELMKAVRSQQKLASLADPARKIAPCAVNTLKSAADLYLPGGFKELENLRLYAKSRLANVTRQISTKKSKVMLNENIVRLERQVCVQNEDLAVLTWVLVKLLRQGRNYADQAGGAVVHICKKEQNELLTMMTERERLSAYLKSETSELVDEISTLTWFFKKALSQGKKYAQEAGPHIVLMCEREQSELIAMMKMNPRQGRANAREI